MIRLPAWECGQNVLGVVQNALFAALAVEFHLENLVGAVTALLHPLDLQLESRDESPEAVDSDSPSDDDCRCVLLTHVCCPSFVVV